jgi:hypothetical protein
MSRSIASAITSIGPAGLASIGSGVGHLFSKLFGDAAPGDAGGGIFGPWNVEPSLDPTGSVWGTYDPGADFNAWMMPSAALGDLGGVDPWLSSGPDPWDYAPGGGIDATAAVADWGFTTGFTPAGDFDLAALDPGWGLAGVGMAHADRILRPTHTRTPSQYRAPI